MNVDHEVRKARKGNKNAFVALIKYYESSLYRVAKSYLKTDSDCADAIQETILKAYQAIKGLKEPKYFRTWLIRILINECNRILQVRKKIIPVQELRERIQPEIGTQRIELQEILHLVEEELRVIITLYYQEDLSVKDIALLLDIPEGTVKSRLSRAREKLAYYLTEDFEKRGVSYE